MRVVLKVRIARDTSSPLWCIWAVGWPSVFLSKQELAHPSVDYLGGYFRIEDARAAAELAGWMVDE